MAEARRRALASNGKRRNKKERKKEKEKERKKEACHITVPRNMCKAATSQWTLQRRSLCIGCLLVQGHFY